MKLIDEKKFLEEIDKVRVDTDKFGWVHYDDTKGIFSKHLKDLPKKKTYTKGYGYDDDTMAHSEGGDGYNQCISDMEDAK